VAKGLSENTGLKKRKISVNLKTSPGAKRGISLRGRNVKNAAESLGRKGKRGQRTVGGGRADPWRGGTPSMETRWRLAKKRPQGILVEERGDPVLFGP